MLYSVTNHAVYVPRGPLVLPYNKCINSFIHAGRSRAMSACLNFDSLVQTNFSVKSNAVSVAIPTQQSYHVKQ